jgi:uncharacterized protein YndB with AHSA1/START domain
MRGKRRLETGNWELEVDMTLTLVTIAGIAAAVVYWFPVRQWYRQSGAMRLEGARAMSGDTTFLVRDQDSTLAITIDAPPAEVWDALLHFGWPQQGRPMYEWLGRRFGYLQARGTEQGLGAGAEVTPALPVGPHSEIPVLSVDPTRILVLGRETSDRRWTWQFEVSTLNERQTRLILRARALKTKSSQALSRAVSFVLTRKMLLDIKRSAESSIRSRQSSHLRVV